MARTMQTAPKAGVIQTSKKKPAKATTKGGVTKKESSHHHHPPYAQMIKKAINDLNNKKGSSRAAILKYIVEHYDITQPVGEQPTNQHLNKALKHGLETGELKHATSNANGASGSFKLGDKSKKTSVKAKSTAENDQNGNAAAGGDSTPKKSKKTTTTKKSPAAIAEKSKKKPFVTGRMQVSYKHPTKKGKAAAAKK